MDRPTGCRWARSSFFCTVASSLATVGSFPTSILSSTITSSSEESSSSVEKPCKWSSSLIFVARIGLIPARPDWITNHNNLGLDMVPKFANPHSLLQDVEITTRSEITERAGLTFVDYDEDSRSLKRDLDNLLRDTWGDALADTSSPSRAKKHRKTTESSENGQLGKDFLNRETLVLKHPPAFRLVSSMKRPQHISLDPKPPPPPVYVSAGLGPFEVTDHLARSREPDYEDDEMQAEVRRIRALSVAVEFESLGEAAVSIRQVEPKVVLIDIMAVLRSHFRSLSRCHSPTRFFLDLYLLCSSLKRFAQRSESKLDIRRPVKVPHRHHTSPGCLALSCL